MQHQIRDMTTFFTVYASFFSENGFCCCLECYVVKVETVAKHKASRDGGSREIIINFQIEKNS